MRCPQTVQPGACSSAFTLNVGSTGLVKLTTDNYQQVVCVHFFHLLVAEDSVVSDMQGQGYRAPPPVLHGYSAPVTGETHEERLDIRCAKKADKFCK
jgi:hypothetical protein